MMKIIKLIFGLFPVRIKLLILTKLTGSAIGKRLKIATNTAFFASRTARWSFGDDIILSSGLDNPTCSRSCKIVIGAGALLEIGSNVGMSGVSIGCNEYISIGNNCVLGGDVMIIDSDYHSLDYLERRDDSGIIKHSPVKIGRDTFIGTRTIIGKGVSIGDRSIVAAGSLVVSDIPKDQVWGGVPAVRIK